jgi:hypothetical protein
MRILLLVIRMTESNYTRLKVNVTHRRKGDICAEFCMNWGFYDRDMKNAVFWDTTSCGSYWNTRFGETSSFHPQGGKNPRARNMLAVTNKRIWNFD